MPQTGCYLHECQLALHWVQMHGTHPSTLRDCRHPWFLYLRNIWHRWNCHHPDHMQMVQISNSQKTLHNATSRHNYLRSWHNNTTTIEQQFEIITEFSIRRCLCNISEPQPFHIYLEQCIAFCSAQYLDWIYNFPTGIMIILVPSCCP